MFHKTSSCMLRRAMSVRSRLRLRQVVKVRYVHQCWSYMNESTSGSPMRLGLRGGSVCLVEEVADHQNKQRRHVGCDNSDVERLLIPKTDG